ncbi:MAG: type III secretion system chaperone [Succinivibrio sp.]|nr:type III secretion system chaperone [Succinivibrio sp.]
MNFELKKDAIYVYSPLGTSESCSREALLYLLEESHDGSFFASISPVSKDLCLNFVCARADDYEYFEDKLSSFIRKLRALKSNLSSESFAAAPSPGTAGKASLDDLIFNAISV